MDTPGAYGLIDKEDEREGLNFVESKKRITVRDNLIFCDTRDCVAEQSLLDTQNVFELRGGRGEFSDNVSTTTGGGVTVVVTLINAFTSDDLKDGDTVYISGVQGNKAANGSWVIQNILGSTFELKGSVGNGNYAGGGTIIRKADSGWPCIKDETNTIYGNEMTIKLSKKLKVIRSLSLIHAVIPRDIIPLTTYLPDFLAFSEFSTSDVPTCPEVRVATTAPGVLGTSFEEGDLIDGVVLVENDRILIKDQASSIENGIYVVQSSGSPLRSSDMPTTTPASVVLNYYVVVTEGIVNTDTSWVCTTSGVVGVGALVFTVFTGKPISWASYIPQEKDGVYERVIGFYSTPLELFRTYIKGSFSLPNQYTPPPLVLWNPVVGGATHQLQPYPNQTVPTYKSDNFGVVGKTGDFYVILSGYGVYDMNDWTYRLDPVNLVNSVITRIGRILLLLAITPNQSYNDSDEVSLIINSNVTSNTTATDFFGYGDYQRFIPGPGIGTHYQPGTSDNTDPTVADPTDWPIPFPNFRGNVWGPYNSPGDRFQKMGLRDVLQDLYLNGDTRNVFGNNIIKPWVSVECIPSDSTFGIYFPAFTELTFGNVSKSTSPNIMNAMRVVPNGFGALDVQGLGNSATMTTGFLGSGGQGPDTNGVPQEGYIATPGGGGAWVDGEVLDATGTGELGDEIATGPNFIPTQVVGLENMSTNYADASYIGTETTQAGTINRRIAYYDLGPNSDNFSKQIDRYLEWMISELPDTNVIISIFQAERDQRVQFSNQQHTSCILSCPIRLNLGTATGTREYMENIQSLLSDSGTFWGKRYLSPLQSLYKLSIKFTTFEGNPIPLEKMLQPSRTIMLLQSFDQAFGNTSTNPFSSVDTTANATSFSFDPLDPRLVGREKRNISLTFKVQTYEYESPGLYLDLVQEMLESENEQENHHPFVVRASNYQNYRNT